MSKRLLQEDIDNEKIRFNEVLLIDENGEQLGIKSRVEAMGIAASRDLDLFDRLNPIIFLNSIEHVFFK